MVPVELFWHQFRKQTAVVVLVVVKETIHVALFVWTR